MTIVSNVTFADEFFSKELPLPKPYLDTSKFCTYVDASMYKKLKESTDHADEITTYKTLATFQFVEGTNSLYSGLCLLSANLNDAAVESFKQSKNHFIQGIEKSIDSLEVANRDLKKKSKDTKFFYEFITIALDFAGVVKQGKNASFTEGLNLAKGIIDDVKTAQLASINMAVADMNKNNNKINLNKTIRIPVSPYIGFLKNIVKVQMPEGGHCTGSFVGPRLVLTNLHCVKNGILVVQDTLVSSRKFTVKTWHTARGERGVLSNEEVKSKVCLEYCEKDDWAIIEINETRHDANDFFVIKEKTEGLESLMVTGYSADVSKGSILTADINCPVVKVGINLEFDCSTYSGSSGSPILSVYDQRYVVALNNSAIMVKDNENNRASKFGIRVENFYPTWKKLIDQQGGFKQADAKDARHYLKAYGDSVNNQNKLEKLDKW